MAKIQAVWAIDIGQAALKALKLVPGETPESVVAEAFDFIEYPKILSQPDADPEQLVRESLETFLERNDLKGCKVAIAVPGQAGLVKFIKLPPVEKKRIPDIVKFEARQQIPFALEEVVWAYQQIGGDAEEGGDEDFTMAEVGLFAMKRDQINRAIQPFKAAGIEVDIVQMGPIALYNYITFDKLKKGEANDSVVVLDIGADNTDLIITDGTRIWQRNVPIGGNHFTRALTKELKLTFAKAEHLKRNATKAPDPRAIFTAMRGVFNDFASEVNRSIGFYSSVNRSAKISKVVGLGNGFKLPGLQKFLQQNLSHEVEKLEGFDRMTGDEVKGQPVFLDNMPSFAAAYGLGVQGLGRGGLSTNLLPPEIEQVRLIRAKKPWVLAASALLMLGFGALFLGEYRVLAKVETLPFANAVAAANEVSKRGADFNTQFAAAKGSWEGKNNEGMALIGNAEERGLWPDFLRTLSTYLPDPERELGLKRGNPDDAPKIDRLQVHIDAIKPVWRADVATEWFSDPKVLRENLKDFMHPYDRANAPAGAGWVIQVIGHHYNPSPGADQLKLPVNDPKRIDFGTYEYLLRRIIPKLNDPRFRLYGVNHVALSWISSDKEWTSEKGSQTNGLSNNTVPVLARATPPKAEAGGEGGPGGPMGAGGPGGGGAGYAGMGNGPMMGAGYGATAGGMRSPMGGSYGGMGTAYSSMGTAGTSSDAKKKLTTLTRTDFLLTFVWQPVKPADRVAPGSEGYKTKLADEVKKLTEAETKNPVGKLPTAEEMEKSSLQQSQQVDSALQKMQQKAAAPSAAGAPPAAGTPPAAGAPAAGTPKAGTPAAPSAGAPK